MTVALTDVESPTVECNSEVTASKDSSEKFEVYLRRWPVLFSFCTANVANAIVWASFAPISDLAQKYFGSSSSFYGSVTGINMLAVIAFIVFPFGAVYSFWANRFFKPRKAMLIATFVTATGTLLKFLAARFTDSLGNANTYGLMMLGQALCGFMRCSFVSYPAAISATWFPSNEREMATAIGSISSSLGSAFGALIPPLFVSEETESDGSVTIVGMDSLKLFQFVYNLIALLLLFVVMQDAPPTPPSLSTKLKGDREKTAAKSKQHATSRDITKYSSIENNENEINENDNDKNRENDNQNTIVDEDNNHTNHKNNNSGNFLQLSDIWRDISTLLHNKDYVVLWISFAIAVGVFNGLLTVTNQFVGAVGYTNRDSGFIAAIFVICGIIGTFINTYIMNRTKDYTSNMRVLILISNGTLLFVLAMLYRNNRALLYFAFACFGLTTLPLLPLVIENCAEISYPVPEFISYGLVTVLVNVFSLIFTFVFQTLIQVGRFAPRPLTAINIGMYILYVGLTVTIVCGYKGKSLRVQLDHRDPGGSPANVGMQNVHDTSNLDKNMDKNVDDNNNFGDNNTKNYNSHDNTEGDEDGLTMQEVMMIDDKDNSDSQRNMESKMQA